MHDAIVVVWAPIGFHVIECPLAIVLMGGGADVAEVYSYEIITVRSVVLVVYSKCMHQFVGHDAIRVAALSDTESLATGEERNPSHI